jgi:hypothetical protein
VQCYQPTLATRAADTSGALVADVRFGFPQRDGQPAPGSVNKEGRMLVAQVGPDEYLLTGIGGAVFFHRPSFLPGIRMQILTAEEGYYTPGFTPGGQETWHATRILNGDETDRGIRFPRPVLFSDKPRRKHSHFGRFGCGRDWPFRAHGGVYHAGPILANPPRLGSILNSHIIAFTLIERRALLAPPGWIDVYR